MYLEFFQLNEHPFQLTPDSEFLYMSESHSRAKAYMDYTIWNRDGFVVVTGEIGAGKTTLLQKLLSEFDETVAVAKIYQTQLDELQFLQAVLVEFGLNPFNAKKVELMDMLSTFLIDSFLQSKQLVLIVDEAQNLGPKVLEEIRMLSGLETQKEKILHVILVGQPELNDILDSPEMEQLLQRVRLRCHISALSESDTRDYISHRLRVAGAGDRKIFDPDVIPLLYEYTGGIPRLTNVLCDMALTCAFSEQSSVVSTASVRTAIEELQWKPYGERLKARARMQKVAGKNRELRHLFEENTKQLASLVDGLSRIGDFRPLLGDLVDKMSRIEKSLERLAGRDSSLANPKTAVAQKRRELKNTK